MSELRNTRRTISWIKVARRDFDGFPARAMGRAYDALTVVADGGMPDIAKPLTGLGAGVWELAMEMLGG